MNVKAGRSICKKAKPCRWLPQKYTLFAFCQYVVSTFFPMVPETHITAITTTQFNFKSKEDFKMLLFWHKKSKFAPILAYKQQKH